MRRLRAGALVAEEPASRMEAMASAAAAEGMRGSAALASATLDDSEPAVREQAVYALVPEGSGLERLVAAAARDPDPSVRRAAVMQLGAGESGDVWQPLTEALRDPDSGVVEEALVALATLGEARAAPHVRPLLSHPDEAIQSLAADTLEALAEEP